MALCLQGPPFTAGHSSIGSPTVSIGLAGAKRRASPMIEGKCRNHQPAVNGGPKRRSPVNGAADVQTSVEQFPICTLTPVPT